MIGKNRSLLTTGLFLLTLLLMIYLLSIFRSPQNFGRGENFNCPLALPTSPPISYQQQTADESYTRTPTPNGTDIALNQTLAARITPTTPQPTLVISKVTNLSPELKDSQKYSVLVTHSDGTNEEFKVGPTVQIGSISFPLDICAKIPFKTGEKVIQWYDIGELETARNRVRIVATYEAQNRLEGATYEAQQKITPSTGSPGVSYPYPPESLTSTPSQH